MGGRYRYYKCNTRIGRADSESKPIPMPVLHDLVLESLADKGFTPDRLRAMLEDVRERQKSSADDQEAELEPLHKELDGIEQETPRLYEAAGKGYLPMTSPLVIMPKNCRTGGRRFSPP